MTAYYNEIDPFAAEWLRELIKAGAITPGTVDDRSIDDVRPSDLRGFTQCHFFAGIGVWSYALRQSGWSDDRPVWTGSCPCQPFSAAGKGAGFADERHLWPAFFHLVEQCRPTIVFGEQVASKAVEPWIDLVQTDLEAVGYAFGCVPFPSASVGAPHIRDRAYWVADASGARLSPRECKFISGAQRDQKRGAVEQCGCPPSRLADSEGKQFEHQAERERRGDIEWGCATLWLANNQGEQCSREMRIPGDESNIVREGIEAGRCVHFDGEQRLASSSSCPTNGFWRDVDWLFCRDGKWRPVEPGTSPLVNGAAQRVGRLRGYGNAINAEAAKAFITAFMEGRGDETAIS